VLDAGSMISTTVSRRLDLANALALLGSSALLGGALAFQHLGGLAPCEMCFWQRWPHLAAILLGLAAFGLARSALRKPLLLLAGVAILVAAGLGLFHAGVEQRWWEGPTQCSAAPTAGTSAQDILAEVMAAPIVRCDAIPWELFGLSLAGWNALLSALIGGAVLWLVARR
jgi:disulfide bond formation protein DsbB